MPTGITFTTGQVVTEAQLDALNTFVNDLEASTLPSAWVDVTYATNWITEGSALVALQVRGTAAYSELRGIVQRITSATVTSSVVGTIPLAFRPTEKIQTAVDAPNSGTLLARTRLDINTNGQIVVYGNWPTFSNFFYESVRWTQG